MLNYKQRCYRAHKLGISIEQYRQSIRAGLIVEPPVDIITSLVFTNDVLPIAEIIAKLKELNPKGVPPYSDNYLACRQRCLNRWQQLHPDKVREYRKPGAHSRRARERNARGSFTRTEWCELKELYNNRCAYCKKRSNRLTVDHIIPLIKGGANSIDNIVPACGRCNSRKRDKLWNAQLSLR